MKKQFIYLIIILLYVPDYTFSQNNHFQWVKQFYKGRACIDISVDNSGFVYSLFNFADTAEFGPKITEKCFVNGGAIICKMDSSGQIIWTKQLTRAFGYSIVAGEEGNLYISGAFNNKVDFDLGLDSFNLTSIGKYDFYILKLDSAGNFKWVTQIGTIDDDYRFPFIINNSGNVFLTGNFSDSILFISKSGSILNNSKGYNDVFACTINPSGYATIKQYGSKGNETVSNIELYQDSFFYIKGDFNDTFEIVSKFDTSKLIPDGINNNYVFKLDKQGEIKWAKRIEYANLPSIKIVDSGSFYTLNLKKDSFITYDTVIYNSNNGNMDTINKRYRSDLRIVKQDPNGDTIWIRKYRGSFDNSISYIGIDKSENILISGNFRFDSIDFNPNYGSYFIRPLVNKNGNYSNNFFVLNLNSNGGFNWVKSISNGYHIKSKLDSNGDVYIIGSIAIKTKLDTLSNIILYGDNDHYNMLVVKINNNGTYSFINNYGDGGFNIVGCIAIENKSQYVYVGGEFGYSGGASDGNPVDFNPSSRNHYLTSSLFKQAAKGGYQLISAANGFIQKFGEQELIESNILNINRLESQYIYPNPANTYFNLDLTSYSKIRPTDIVIQSIEGRSVLKYQLENNTLNKSVDISSLKEGIYFVSISSKDFSHSVKLQIQR